MRKKWGVKFSVEGMMLGAVAAFAIKHIEQSLFWHYFGACRWHYSGRLPFFLLATNQMATGLALAIFGTGLSGFVGAPYVGTIEGLNALAIPFLTCR